MPSRAVRQALAKSAALVTELKLALFGLATPDSAGALEAHGRLQASRYGHLGLGHVPAERMPAAVAWVFDRLDLRPAERLLEIGPGPHAGVGLIAALMGLQVVMVEYDQPFLVDVDRLRRELASSPESASTLAGLGSLHGSVEVRPIENLERVVGPYRHLIAVAGGSLRIVPGDFANPGLQDAVRTSGPFDHVVCTDVIDPTTGALAATGAATTTAGDDKVRSMVAGLGLVGAEARTLFMSVVIPEENPDFSDAIGRLYGTLEESLRREGRAVRYERVICPASSTVVRARLYDLSPATRPE